jgi:homogentisate phytyltransferase / homogentisate geranylgeranyltransferase
MKHFLRRKIFPFLPQFHPMIPAVMGLIATIIIWQTLISPSLEKLSFLEKLNNDSQLSFAAVIAFCRPHTIKGTLLASTSGYILLWVYSGYTHALFTLALVLFSGVSANVFIVGINQLVDVEIDRLNGKRLPVATGELAWRDAKNIVQFALLSAVSVAFAQSILWGTVISLMCAIGFVYSVPPLRLKRFAVPAAVCIVLARAVLGTVGGAVTYANAMGRPLDHFASQHLFTFTGIMMVFTTVIALMKDVPDIEGDKSEGVQSFSVTKGAAWVVRLCYGLISAVYVIVGLKAVFWDADLVCLTLHVAAFIWLHTRSVEGASKSVAMHNYLNVVWPLFYFEFFAYLAPVGLDRLGVHVPYQLLAGLLGLEVGYVVTADAPTVAGCGELVDGILEKSGMNVDSLTKNLRLRGTRRVLRGGELNSLAEPAVEVAVALGMHAKLTKLTGKSFSNAKKLAVLAGDWLLAKAVIALCKTGNMRAVHLMGQSIAAATKVPESQMTETIIKFAKECRD